MFQKVIRCIRNFTYRVLTNIDILSAHYFNDSLLPGHAAAQLHGEQLAATGQGEERTAG